MPLLVALGVMLAVHLNGFEPLQVAASGGVALHALMHQLQFAKTTQRVMESTPNPDKLTHSTRVGLAGCAALLVSLPLFALDGVILYAVLT